MSYDNSQMWRKILSYVLVGAVSAVIAFLLGTATNPDINYTSTGAFIDNEDKVDEVRELLKDNFIGDVNDEALTDAAVAAMVKATGDKWSYYMTPEEYKLHLENAKNEYEGIGVTVRQEKENGAFIIEKVESGGGAAVAGLQVGDAITHIEDVSVADMTTADGRNKIRGKKGSSVKLTCRRGTESFSVMVSRGPIAVDVASCQMVGKDIGLITIANFDDRCKTETVECIEELIKKGAKALIFDVRNNPGGYKHELVNILDYLLPEGVLFSSETYDGKKEQDKSDATCLKLPMAVLINKDSYSAAEFFAAALEEYQWAVTVGEPTTGKGYFQTNIDLEDGSAIHLSVGKYFTPKGVSLAEVGGIKPSIEIKLEEAVAKALAAGTLEPEQDPHVQAAVKALQEKLK